MTDTDRTGGQILVDQLLLHGADRAFCVPGESYLAVLDALHDVTDRFTLINARHEAGAANMAEAMGKLTGRPGIALVTRGPGACHAAVGVHIAQQDSTPMILLVGQVGRPTRDRESFQEIDYTAMFAPVAKWVAQIDDTRRIPEYLARAFRTATSGRPGPVVLALPEDMLTERVAVPDARPARASVPALTPDNARTVMQALDGAQRPIMLVGGSGWTQTGIDALATFARANRLPVATSFRRQDLIDTRSEAYVGDFGTGVAPALTAALAQADVLLVVGARLGEITTKTYTTLAVPTPAQRLVHIHVDADEIGRVYAPDCSAVSGPDAALTALAACAPRPAPDAWRAGLRDALLGDMEPPPHDHPLDMGTALAQANDVIPRDAVITLDAGNHTGWAHRFLHFGRPGRQIASTCGAMGYAIPAAVAASLADPARQVVAFVGDGGFMMSGMEIATAVQHGARPVILVFNNGTYGTIRMHQERDHPGRVSGTDLLTTDIGRIATGLGAAHARVRETDAFGPELAKAFARDTPTVIELMTDPAQISTRTTIQALRDTARP